MYKEGPWVKHLRSMMSWQIHNSRGQKTTVRRTKMWMERFGSLNVWYLTPWHFICSPQISCIF